MPEFPDGYPASWDWALPDLARLIPPGRLDDALGVGDLATVVELITANPEWLNGFWHGDPETSRWVIPLEVAAYGGFPDIVAWLLERGATPDVREHERDETPLWSAAWQARQVWAEVLRPSCHRFLRIARLLIDAGADPHADCRGRAVTREPDGLHTPDGVMRAFSQVGLLDAIAESERRFGTG